MTPIYILLKERTTLRCSTSHHQHQQVRCIPKIINNDSVLCKYDGFHATHSSHEKLKDEEVVYRTTYWTNPHCCIVAEHPTFCKNTSAHDYQPSRTTSTSCVTSILGIFIFLLLGVPFIRKSSLGYSLVSSQVLLTLGFQAKPPMLQNLYLGTFPEAYPRH